MGLARPPMEDGPPRDLVMAVHDLYDRVKAPGLTTLETRVRSLMGAPGISRSTIGDILNGKVPPLKKRSNIAALTRALLDFDDGTTTGEQQDRELKSILELHRLAFETAPENRWGTNIADHFSALALEWGGAFDESPRKGVHGVVTVSCPPRDRDVEFGVFAPRLHWEISDMFESQMYLRFGTTSWPEQTEVGPTWWGIRGPRGLSTGSDRTDVLFLAARLDMQGTVSVYFRDSLGPGDHVLGHLAFDALTAALHISTIWGLTGTAHVSYDAQAYPVDRQRRRASSGYSRTNVGINLGVPSAEENLSGWARRKAASVIDAYLSTRNTPWAPQQWIDKRKSLKVPFVDPVSPDRYEDLITSLHKWHEDGLEMRLRHLQEIRRRPRKPRLRPIP